MYGKINELLDGIWRFKLDYFNNRIIRPEDERLQKLLENVEEVLKKSRDEIDVLTSENEQLEDELNSRDSDEQGRLYYLVDSLRDLVKEYED